MTDKPSESSDLDGGVDPGADPELAEESLPTAEQGEPVDTSECVGPEETGGDGSESPKSFATIGTATPQPVSPIPVHGPVQGPAPVQGGWSAPAQPVPPMFDGFWPEPDVSRAPLSLVAAVIGGAGAALFVPFGRPGIGWPLLGLTIAIGLVLVGRKAHSTVHMGRILWLVVTLLLLAVCAFRAAEWLAALCVLTACVSGTLSVTGGRSVRAIGMAAIAIPLAVFRALPWAIRGMREREGGKGGVRLVASLVVGLLLLVIFGALFSSADERFADLISVVLPTLDGETFVRWTFLFGLFFFFCLGAAFTLIRPPALSKPVGAVRTLRRFEWAFPVGVLVVLFATFVVVQGNPMFGAGQHVQNTERLTYAGYARSGFWQLMMVTILTLPVIGAAARWAPKHSKWDRNLLRGLAGLLALLTLMIVASALVRMGAYQAAYGYTVMRLLVMFCELWLGVVYVLVIAAGVRLRASWLPSAAIGTAMAALLLLAVVNPEGVIAERNIARYQATGKLDQSYLSNLSPDAFGALRELPDRQREEITADMDVDLVNTDWRTWNLSRQLTADQR